MKLGMGKNGLSLKKPEKVTPIKPSLYGPKGGRRYLTKDDPDLFKPKKDDEILPQKKKRGRPFSKDKTNQANQKNSLKGPMSKIVEEKANPGTDPNDSDQDDNSENEEGTENSDENSDDSENSADDEEEEGPTEDSDSEDKPIIIRSKKQFPATKLAKQLRMRQEENMKKYAHCASVGDQGHCAQRCRCFVAHPRCLAEGPDTSAPKTQHK